MRFTSMVSVLVGSACDSAGDFEVLEGNWERATTTSIDYVIISGDTVMRSVFLNAGTLASATRNRTATR